MALAAAGAGLPEDGLRQGLLLPYRMPPLPPLAAGGAAVQAPVAPESRHPLCSVRSRQQRWEAARWSARGSEGSAGKQGCKGQQHVIYWLQR